MNTWDIYDNQLDITWRFNENDITSTIVKQYMFSAIDDEIEHELRTCICSYNEAVTLYNNKFCYTNDKGHCPFFIYELDHYDYSDDVISLTETNGYTSFYDIHRDNKTYTIHKKYIVYTQSMIINHIESKLDVCHKIIKSPLNSELFLVWICTKNGNTISFLRSSENSIEWDNTKTAAEAIYQFYKKYWDNNEL